MRRGLSTRPVSLRIPTVWAMDFRPARRNTRSSASRSAATTSTLTTTSRSKIRLTWRHRPGFRLSGTTGRGSRRRMPAATRLPPGAISKTSSRNSPGWQQPSGFRFLRSLRLASTIEGDRLAYQRHEGGLIDFNSLGDVDGAAYLAVETGVEESGRILQRRAPGEGELYNFLVGLASADNAVVRPHRSGHPLPLLDDVRVRLLDQPAHSLEGFPAPVPELGDSFRDQH